VVDGLDAPTPAEAGSLGLDLSHLPEQSMDPIAIVGLDLAKRIFQVHGARADGSVALRKKLSRPQVLTFFAQLPACIVAMEACASAHEWGRAIRELGHEVRLIPPIYVKPFIKRQKNDAADAEAIAEAASRPTMRFVAIKSEAQQAQAMIFRTRDLLVRQRTQLINALRGHLAEHGIVAPQGATNVRQLALAIDDVATALDPLVADLSRRDARCSECSRIATRGRSDRRDRCRRRGGARAKPAPGHRARSLPGPNVTRASPRSDGRRHRSRRRLRRTRPRSRHT
jgi:transposase